MTSGNSAPRKLIEAVPTQTEGNPLSVTEVVRLSVQEIHVGARHAVPLHESDSWAIRIPEGVREVIGRRLNRLSQRCNETLTVASILGPEFTLAQLRPLAEEVSDDRLLEVLEEALASRVNEELPQSVGQYQFTHALIQETLAEELSINRRVRLHGRIAEVLEGLYGDEADGQTAELAHHFSQAEAMVGTEKLVHYSMVAGERTLAAYAWEEALAHFQRALTTKERQAIDADSAALLFGLRRAQLATLDQDQLGEALASLERAFDYYIDTGDVENAGAVAEYHLPGAARHRLGITLVARVMPLVPPDSHLAGRPSFLNMAWSSVATEATTRGP